MIPSPPAKHDPPDNGPGREDADAHPPLRQVETGPQRHSDDAFAASAPLIAREVLGATWGVILREHEARASEIIAAALRSVDRAAREECARIADGSAGPFPKGKRIAADGSEARELAIAMQHGLGGGRDAIAAAIRQTIKG